MNKLAIATVLVVFTTLLPRAYAGAPGTPVCCACIEAFRAETSGTNNTTQTAFFCAPALLGNLEPLAERCDGISEDTRLTCRATLDNSSCRSQLAATGVICPGSPAPAVSGLNLATLAMSLAAVGALLLHRRRRV